MDERGRKMSRGKYLDSVGERLRESLNEEGSECEGELGYSEVSLVQ